MLFEQLNKTTAYLTLYKNIPL